LKVDFPRITKFLQNSKKVMLIYDNMKKTALLFPFFILLLLIPQIAQANVNVNISDNKEGSKSNVSVNSNTSGSSSNTNNSGSNTTNIRIETNGEVKEYYGTGDEAINIQSSNGNNSVTVNPGNPSAKPSQNSNTSINTNITTNVTSGNSNASPSAEINVSENNEKHEFALIEFLKKEFESLLKLFSF